MRVARLVLKVLGYFAVMCVWLFAAMWIGGQIGQHVFRRRVERLLAELHTIELGKTSWEQAQARFSEWQAHRRYSPDCDAHQCSFGIELWDPVAGFISEKDWFDRLDDYVRWRLKRRYGGGEGPFARFWARLSALYLQIGWHPGHVTAGVEMRDGKVSGESVFVAIETYGHPIGWSGDFQQEFSLSAWAYSVEHLPTKYDWDFKPEHSDYEIVRHPCTVCVLGVVRFTPNAAASDVNRLTQINTSCFTRWKPCLTQADILPAAWKQYIAENGPLP